MGLESRRVVAGPRFDTPLLRSGALRGAQRVGLFSGAPEIAGKALVDGRHKPSEPSLTGPQHGLARAVPGVHHWT